MSLTIKILFYIVTSFCVATGQCLLSLYAKGIPSPFGISRWFYYSLSNHFLYGGVALYGVSFVMFIILLRMFPLAQISITLIAILMIMICFYNYMFGQELNLIQYMGAFLAVTGLIALNW